jgi:hypothetical protein
MRLSGMVVSSSKEEFILLTTYIVSVYAVFSQSSKHSNHYYIKVFQIALGMTGECFLVCVFRIMLTTYYRATGAAFRVVGNIMPAYYH